MKLLLDTHIALWAVLDEPPLPGAARAAIGAAEEGVFVSVVSVWEIAIKHAVRRRGGEPAIAVSGTRALTRFEAAGFELLPVTAAHAAAVDHLPPLHGDTFDRLLVAQATLEPLRLLTHDRRLAAYGAMVLPV